MKRVVYSALLVLFIASCTQNQKTSSVDSGDLTAYISTYTSGEISKTQPITIWFTSDVGPSDALLKPLKQNPFMFEPGIEGSSVWTARNSLEFRPTQPLMPGTSYTGIIDLKAFFELPQDAPPFRFNFQTTPRAFEITMGHLRSSNLDSLESQFMEGVIVTSDVEDPAVFSNILTANQAGRLCPISWEHEKDGRTHHFRITEIKRGDKSSELNINWSANLPGLTFKGEKTISVPPANEFTLMSMEAVAYPEQHLILTFSDPISTETDLTGFVRIGNENLRLVVDGNQIKAWPSHRLTGEVIVNIEPGIENILGYRLKQQLKMNASFAAILPELRLSGNGVIIPSDSRGVLFPFEAANINAVDVQIVKIFENNIPQFLQINQIDGDYELHRVGEEILNQKVVLDPNGDLDLTRWNRHVLDLARLIETEPGAIYRISLGFRKSYSLYPCAQTDNNEDTQASFENIEEEEQSGWTYYNNVPYNWNERNDPCSRSFYNQDRAVSRNVLASNLGLMAKVGEDGATRVLVHDLKTTNPVIGARVLLYDYRNQLLSEAKTDKTGQVALDLGATPFLVVAENGAQRGYLDLKSWTNLSLSRFDVGGATLNRGINGYFYGERSVWRPGDEIFLTFILRDPKKKLPEDHPIQMELFDPSYKLVHKQIVRDHVNNFYSFHIKTDPEAPTGNYTVSAKIGGITFTRPIKIETVMPNRLKIRMEVDPLIPGSAANAHLETAWLHGAVARDLKTIVQMTLSRARTQFNTHKDYVFDDPTRSFASTTETLFEGRVDNQGRVDFPIKVGSVENAPGQLRAGFTARVFEPGGAASSDSFTVPFNPYKTYVGVRLPKGDQARGMLLTDTDHPIDIVALNAEGQPQVRQNIRVAIYKLDWRWWWDQDANQSADFESSLNTVPLHEEWVNTNELGEGKGTLRVNYPEWGRYLVRVTDQDGHSSGKIFYIDWPGWAGRQRDQAPGGASMLVFNADRTRYQVGDRATLSIPGGAQGRAIISLESGSRVLSIDQVETTKGTTQYSFTITSEMAPNIYAHVTMLQPHAQTANDLPIRLYGVIPLLVENPETVLEPVLKMPEVLQPQSEVSLSVSEARGRAMTYTLAMVDEGLLDLTRFETPKPREFFYARQALTVNTWDIYDRVLGAFGGEMKALLSIGGGYAEVKVDNHKANRFKPMVRFLGPFTLQPGQTAQHKLDIPLYVGSVRTMVVAGMDGAYGSSEKTTPVRKPLMLLGTLPRVLSPGEQVAFPVSVFALEDKVKQVELSLTTNELLISEGSPRQTLTFADTGDQIVSFPLKIADRTGVGRCKVTARSGMESAEFEIEIQVRSPNPFINHSQQTIIRPGESWSAEWEPVGMVGTNSGHLEISSVAPLNLAERLNYLVTYPHGCVEQTTSAVFPQLYLSRLMDLPDSQKRNIEANIKAGINRLGMMQISSGGLSYWPGSGEADLWGTNYAGHFMLEAREAGYNLPPDFLNRWTSYQRLTASSWETTNDWSRLEQAYRLYLLARAGDAQIGPMNRLREQANSSNSKTNTLCRWLLAGAYHLAGQVEAARTMVAGLSMETLQYQEPGDSYGSAVRDRAMILDVCQSMGLKDKIADLSQQISQDLNDQDQWMSTHTLGYSLSAMARMITSGSYSLQFTYEMAGKTKTLQRQLPMEQLEIQADLPGKCKITNPGQAPLHVRLVQRGQPVAGQEKASESQLALLVQWLDSQGNPTDISQLEQGTDFVAKILVTNKGGSKKNLALSSIFPSGWEIHNPRVLFEQMQLTSKPDYQDFRDDRVFTYFDLKPNGTQIFYINLNAAYKGRYYLPATSVEAMYDNQIHASTPGQWVEVAKK